jgi:phenylalanine-4-hydroxylase
MEFTDNLKFHNLKRLQNFVWWTLEFGLIAENINTSFEILGSGILSSIDEIKNVIKSIKYENKYSTIIKYDIENVVFTRFDYSNLQDRYYYIESFDYLYNSFSSNIDIFLFKGD